MREHENIRGEIVDEVEGWEDKKLLQEFQKRAAEAHELINNSITGDRQKMLSNAIRLNILAGEMVSIADERRRRIPWGED